MKENICRLAFAIIFLIVFPCESQLIRTIVEKVVENVASNACGQLECKLNNAGK